MGEDKSRWESGPTSAPGGQEGDSIPAHDLVAHMLGSGKAEL